jgi:hypothetical protein
VPAGGLVLVAALLVVVGGLSARVPEYAFVMALVLFGVEGSLKLALTHLPHPAGISAVALGAATLDAALFIAASALVIAHRKRLPALWRRTPLLGRLAVLLLGLWLLVSLFQVPQSGHIARGADGFRLVQAYALAAIPGALVLQRRRALTLLMGGLAAIAGYTALRVVVGPSAAERSFALSRPGVTEYGHAFRAVGSFSGAVGLVSYLVPVTVLTFGLFVGVRGRAMKVGAGVVCAFALAGVIGSYSRAGILAVAGGVIVAGALSLRGSASRRLTLIAVACALAACTAGTVLATRASPVVAKRAHGIVDPASDQSIRIRLHTWHLVANDVLRRPLGHGLGTTGRASTLEGGKALTTDNSYLAVLYEQGFAGGVLFVAGLVCACGALARAARGAGVVAAGGVAAFLAYAALALSGDYFGQPGKVLAWTLLGLAAGQAWGSARSNELVDNG